jgi:uncharacterized protein YkwD
MRGSSKVLLTIIFIALVLFLSISLFTIQIFLNDSPPSQNVKETPDFLNKSPEEKGDETITKSNDINEERLENMIHNRVNQRRMANDKSPLSFSDEISSIAEEHSEDMARNNYFSHEGPNGNDVGDRYKEAGYKCEIRIDDSRVARGGENILYTYYKEPFVSMGKPTEYNNMKELSDGIVKQWLNSPTHRENMLKGYWEKEGIGVHVTDNNRVYVTQNFC